MTRVADQWWAQDFGCAPEELRTETTRVQAHTAGLSGNTGLWILVTGAAPVVSMPPDVFERLSERAKGWTSSDVRDPDKLRAELSGLTVGRVGKVIGPALINYGSAATLDLKDAAGAAPLPFDQEMLQAFRVACGEGWEQGGSELEPETPLFGAFDESNQLAALAGYEVWGGSIAHISVVTLPERQKRGLGRAAVARAAQHALGSGLLPQYRALESNTASNVVARRLGFTPYGFSVYVRMSASK